MKIYWFQIINSICSYIRCFVMFCSSSALHILRWKDVGKILPLIIKLPYPSGCIFWKIVLHGFIVIHTCIFYLKIYSNSLKKYTKYTTLQAYGQLIKGRFIETEILFIDVSRLSGIVDFFCNCHDSVQQFAFSLILLVRMVISIFRFFHKLLEPWDSWAQSI